MTQARCWHTATLLPDWSFLIVGGYDGGGNSDVGALPSGELYDPGTGLISASPSMAVARYSHTATLLPDGRVLIAGGYGKAGILASAELYQP